MTHKIKELGELVIDSGQIMIVDPCLVLADEEYHAACLGGSSSKEYLFSPPFGTGVVVSAGGDSVLPVYLEFNETGQPARVVIELNS